MSKPKKIEGGLEHMEILDLALCLALLWEKGADGKEIRNFARRARDKICDEGKPLVQMIIDVPNRKQFVREFLNNL